MNSLNYVKLRGVVGSVNKSRVDDGLPVGFSLATETAYQLDGENCVEVCWHQCSCADKDAAKLNPGDRIELEGRLKNSEYFSNERGRAVFTTIVVNNFKLI